MAAVLLGCGSCLLNGQDLPRPTGSPHPERILAEKWRVEREQLSARKLSPAQRVAAVERWQEENQALLEEVRIKNNGPPRDVNSASPFRFLYLPSDSARPNPDKQALVALEQEVGDAVWTMRSYRISPEKRIHIFDQFLAENRDVLEEMNLLRAKIAWVPAQDPLLAMPPQSWASAPKRLVDQWSAVYREMTE